MQRIVIQLATQTLSLEDAGRLLARYSISSALNGAGSLEGSECTPLGKHLVAAKIGGGLPAGAALKGRRPTGEICTPELYTQAPERDWILSRILWLQGCEPGINSGLAASGHNVDTMARYIYIHGTPDQEPMGEPKSHGCIRMRNSDVIELYDAVNPGVEVVIKN